MNPVVSVFAGPTLAARKTDGVAWFGPAEAGDLLQLASGRPCKVLLIDGLFETARAPWHKEILVLLSRGFTVYGAASLGALRAAELAPFGMRPLGGVSRAYRDGRIVGDDEVAVMHAPSALAYRPLSVAQVDVRATLLRAVRWRVMSALDAHALLAASRAIFFKQRTWAAIADAAHGVLGANSVVPRWLRDNGVPFKRFDAEVALQYVLAEAAVSLQCPPPPETVFLRRLRAQSATESHS